MYVFPQKDYHLSLKYIGKHNILKPTGDYKPLGVSFAPSIRECLEAVPFYYTASKDWQRRKRFVREGRIWYVYTPSYQQEAIIPTIDDYNRTHEKRATGKIEVDYVGAIRVTVRGNSWRYEYV